MATNAQDPKMKYLNDALWFAIHTNKLDELKNFLCLGADPNCSKEMPINSYWTITITPLDDAFDLEHLDAFYCLLDHGADGTQFLNSYLQNMFTQYFRFGDAAKLASFPELVKRVFDDTRVNVRSTNWAYIAAKIIGCAPDAMKDYWFEWIFDDCQTPVNNGFNPLQTVPIDGCEVSIAYDEDELPIIFYALGCWPTTLVRKLLARGAQINVWTDMKGTPLNNLELIQDDRLDMIQLLLEHGAFVVTAAICDGTEYESPVDIAFLNLAVQVLKLFQARGYGSELFEKNRLHIACLFEDEGEVKRLLDAGAYVDTRDYHYRTPLTIAVATGNVELVKLLLKRGASPNPGMKVVSFRLYGPRTNSNKALQNPIFQAVVSNHVEIITILLKDPSISSSGFFSNTYQECVEACYTDVPTGQSKRRSRNLDTRVGVFEQLIKAGAGWKGKKKKKTAKAISDVFTMALLWVCKLNHLEMIKILLGHGANVFATANMKLLPDLDSDAVGCSLFEMPDHPNETPLSLCSDVDCLRYLMNHKLLTCPRTGRFSLPEFLLREHLGDVDIVKEVWSTDENKEHFLKVDTIIRSSCRVGPVGVIKFLLSQKPSWISIPVDLRSEPLRQRGPELSKHIESLLSLGFTFDFGGVETTDESMEFAALLYTDHRFLFAKIMQENCGRLECFDGSTLLQSMAQQEDYQMLALIRNCGHVIRQSTNLLADENVPEDFLNNVSKVFGQPLRLRDMCRIVIRGSLLNSAMRTCHIGKLIEQLSLPTMLKSFLSFGDSARFCHLTASSAECSTSD